MNSRIVNSKSIFEHKKLKSNYYLSKGLIYKELIEKNNFNRLKDKVSKISNIGVNKRYYVEKKEFGVPFFSNTDLGSPNPIDNCKLVSKKLCYNGERIIKEGMTLVSAVGTIGLVAFATKEISGAMTPIGNLIRLEAKEYPGFLYAFLSSKIGQKLIDQLGSGNVQTYLDPTTFGEIPIPNLDKIKQQEIHNLIIEASNLRVEANKLLKNADIIFHEENDILYESYHLDASENDKYISFISKINEKSKLTFKAKNHSKRILEIKKIWENKPGKLLQEYLLNDFRLGNRGVFKRIDSDVIGTEMVSQGDLHRINPKKFKRVIISKKNDGDFAKENQVIFPAVGNGSSEGEILFRPTLAYKTFTNKLLSGDIGRFDCPTIEHAAYLLVALKSKGGFRMMRAFYYGTQLRRPLWELLKEINIPIKNDNVFTTVSNLAIKAYDLRHEADIKEIESWQK